MGVEVENKLEGWCVVEMFGHTKEIGYVTTQAYGAAVLFRVDTPELVEREFTLETPEYVDGKWTPAGAKVKRPPSPAKTRLIGPGAVYAITPCSEETALKAIENFSRRPLILLELPTTPAKELLPGESIAVAVPEDDLGEEIEDDEVEDDIPY
jgi:hypothetical protein